MLHFNFFVVLTDLGYLLISHFTLVKVFLKFLNKPEPKIKGS